ncbi:hypothetical protein GCM10025876_37030 [Demequina litorisediminis]|uniref:Phosphoglycerate kinase n=1 Tax=Demequina litorisediminis TaxID=1849022 RepID=A0ABQ6ILE1_9MICO|nr:hypothetical protein GCM10025876_37030 [Demequina litorisediminis]
MKTIAGLGDLTGKKVLVRSDLNVPLDGTTITDDGRVRASVPTIQALLDAGAAVIVTAHLGRPGGEPKPEYSLAPAAARLAEVLGRPVTLAEDLVGDSAKATVAALEPGQVAMLENVRYDKRETSKVDEERQELAKEPCGVRRCVCLRRLRCGPPQAGVGVRRGAPVARRGRHARREGGRLPLARHHRP